MGKKNQFLSNLKKTFSIISTYALVFAIVIALILIVVPQISINISNLIKNIPTYSENAARYFHVAVDWINNTFHWDLDISEMFDSLSSFLLKTVTGDNFSDPAAGAKTILNMFSSTTTGLYNFVMAIVISIYFLSAKEQLCREMKRLAVAFIPIKYLPKVYEIVDITDTKCGRFLVGDIIDAAFIGFLVFITMSIFNLPYAALIGVIIGVTNIIPFFGPFIGGIPSAFILFLINPGDMIVFVIILVVIQQLDGNLFKPKIIGNQVGLSSFWVLFSVIVGGALFGIIGFILGTPIYAVIYTLIRKRVKNSIDSKGKIAQEALDFEVLNYAKIAEEQKKIREEKESQQREKFKKLIGLGKSDGDDKEEENGENDESTDI
ncbi:MAG: AI-2E family transporter, partial [Ruminococcus sp.]|nr:AI-2E family transporter [Ruminococcus sp.]